MTRADVSTVIQTPRRITHAVAGVDQHSFTLHLARESASVVDGDVDEVGVGNIRCEALSAVDRW